MSIDFRTSSQTSVDYSSFVTDETEFGCCFVYDTATNTVTKTPNFTKSACNAQSGYWITAGLANGACPSDVEITPSSLGCCCACSLKDSYGSYTKQTTLCECESLSGVWTLNTNCTDSNAASLCFKGTTLDGNRLDYRNKRACCHPAYAADGTVYADCTDVCSEKECAELTITPYESTFYLNGRRCDVRVGSASPASSECTLNETGRRVLNSCENSTNVFYWQSVDWKDRYSLAGYSDYTIKKWYDEKFPSKFTESIDQFVFKIRDSENTEFKAVLGPSFVSISPIPFPGLSAANDGIDKISYGCFYMGNADTTCPFNQNTATNDGYFMTLSGNIPSYVYTNNIKNKQNSPIPPNDSGYGGIIATDILAGPNYSVIVSSNGIANVFGKFVWRQSISSQLQIAPLNLIPTNIKKVFGVNHLIPYYSCGENTTRIREWRGAGFIAQKNDNSFEYYSPFNEIQDIISYKQMVASIPAKEYKKMSFSVWGYCGIDSSGFLNCESRDNTIVYTYPRNKRYKHVTCSIEEIFEGSELPVNPTEEYCFAVDEDNYIYQICGKSEKFENKPYASTTEVLDISCVDGFCMAVVEPDENVCNNQVSGACCTCSETQDIFDCTQTTLGACTSVGGNFISGGICNFTLCDNIVDADCTTNSFSTITAPESSLPSPLTFEKDGLYVGIFEPGYPINSVGSSLNGNPNSGNAINYTPNVFGYGTTKKKWGIVVAPSDYTEEMLSVHDPMFDSNTDSMPSLYDGIWNTYGDMNDYYGIQSNEFDKIRSKSRLSGWYLPSKHELEFINKQLSYNYNIPELFNSMKKGIYLSSTNYFLQRSNTQYELLSQSFMGKRFLYGQSFDKENYGAIYLVPQNKKVHIRLIRRIELE